MRLIPLSGKRGAGKFAQVDDEDFELVSKFKWCVSSGGYAVSNFKLNGKYHTQSMHRLVMGKPPGQEVDHRDMVPFNNQKYNLRFCTESENKCNRNKYSNNTTGFKGVCWHKKGLCYIAQIDVGGKHINIGRYPTATEASLAYINKAKELHGEFARW